MRVARCARLAVALGVLLLVAVPATASAFYGNGASGGNGAELISADYARLEQGDDTTDYAAISADGRYVASQTRARNFFADDDPDPPGLYRSRGPVPLRPRDPGAGEGRRRQPLRRSRQRLRAPRRRQARRSAATVATSPSPPPSRWSPADTNDNLDVYVRDMDVPVDCGGRLRPRLRPRRRRRPRPLRPAGLPAAGQRTGRRRGAWRRDLADGQKVVFRTDAPSDLPASASTNVPGRPGLRPRPRRQHDDPGHGHSRLGHAAR